LFSARPSLRSPIGFVLPPPPHPSFTASPASCPYSFFSKSRTAFSSPLSCHLFFFLSRFSPFLISMDDGRFFHPFPRQSLSSPQFPRRLPEVDSFPPLMPRRPFFLLTRVLDAGFPLRPLYLCRLVRSVDEVVFFPTFDCHQRSLFRVLPGNALSTSPCKVPQAELLRSKGSILFLRSSFLRPPFLRLYTLLLTWTFLFPL